MSDLNLKELSDKLLMNRKHACHIISNDEIVAADNFCKGYSLFLDEAKTEREAVNAIVALAKEKGFRQFESEKKYAVGDKVYYNNRGKSIILATIGKKPISEGVRISAAHIDSPRLDLKPCPLYEDSDIGYFKTHYYGGIKKYQWTAMPLSLHGVIIKKNGEKISVNIGEDPTDPVFCVTDLLPHLAQDQMKKTMSEGIKGEDLNIVIGSRPLGDESGAVKLNVIKILNDKYGVVEEDFLSAELEVVPAFKAQDIGFDRSMIGAYGHDDRVCAYPALIAAVDCVSPNYTSVTVLTDKEETGSDGNTGLNSAYLRCFIEDLAKPFGVEGRTVLANSKCLSADVNAAFDPNFSEVYERNNSCYINKGVVITKYTGARGKAGTSDASAEYVYEIRDLLDSKNIVWQTGELGRVDVGGGGTVAAYIANLNVDVIDLGVPVLSMHAPYEIVSKIDVYMAYRAFYEFLSM